MPDTIIPIGQVEDMLNGPYNAEMLLDDHDQPILDELGIPHVDRAYDSADYSNFVRQIISNGVFPNRLVYPPTPANSSGLQVMSLNNSMVLTMRMGAAFVEGRYCILYRREPQFAVPPAHLTLGRRDIVVIRHDMIARTCLPQLIVGTPSATPQPPAIVRNADIYDIQLCTIVVNPNAQAITQANITDTRPNNDVCGFVTGLVRTVDTRDLFAQMQTFLNEQIAYHEGVRNHWRDEHMQWVQNQQDEFAQLGTEIRTLIQSMETKSFNLINNNFDDWSVKRGCTFLTEFLQDGGIRERITVDALDFLLAERLTSFLDNGNISTAITFNAWERAEGINAVISTSHTLTRLTVFEASGSIREVVT